MRFTVLLLVCVMGCSREPTYEQATLTLSAEQEILTRYERELASLAIEHESKLKEANEHQRQLLETDYAGKRDQLVGKIAKQIDNVERAEHTRELVRPKN